MTSTGSERIGMTAHYTAYVWYRLGLVGVTSFAIRAGAMIAMRGRRQATQLSDDDEVRSVFERAGFPGADMVDEALLPDPPRREQMGAIWRAECPRV